MRHIIWTPIKDQPKGMYKMFSPFSKHVTAISKHAKHFDDTDKWYKAISSARSELYKGNPPDRNGFDKPLSILSINNLWQMFVINMLQTEALPERTTLKMYNCVPYGMTFKANQKHVFNCEQWKYCPWCRLRRLDQLQKKLGKQKIISTAVTAPLKPYKKADTKKLMANMKKAIMKVMPKGTFLITILPDLKQEYGFKNIGGAPSTERFRLRVSAFGGDIDRQRLGETYIKKPAKPGAQIKLAIKELRPSMSEIYATYKYPAHLLFEEDPHQFIKYWVGYNKSVTTMKPYGYSLKSKEVHE